MEEAATKLAQQYDGYEPFPGVHINGRQTLAENIADLAGIAASYDGYHASRGGKTAPVQDGFSGDQQFFIAFALEPIAQETAAGAWLPLENKEM